VSPDARGQFDVVGSQYPSSSSPMCGGLRGAAASLDGPSMRSRSTESVSPVDAASNGAAWGFIAATQASLARGFLPVSDLERGL
jgi:hypothetical protein